MKVAMCSSSKTLSSASEDDDELRRGPWTVEEDTLLIHYIARHGEGRWNLLAKRSGLRRTGKSCRLRWLNYLKPDVKRGNLSPQEQLLILDLHTKLGNKWSKIAQYLPGRTDNEIKNYWRTRVQKQARHLKIDANSTAFQDIIRSYWMPRLLQKIDGSNASSAMISQNQTISQPISYDTEHSTLQPQLPPLPPQEVVPTQGPVEMTAKSQNLEHHEQNSDSEQGTSSCISSTESMNLKQVSQLSEYPTTPFHGLGNYSDYGTFLKDCDYVDGNCYSMEALNLGTVPVPGGFGYTGGNRQMAESDWGGCDFGDTMWNTDELWLFRNSQ